MSRLARLIVTAALCVAGGGAVPLQGQPLGRGLGQSNPQRQQLENRLRQQLAQMVKAGLGLSDDQVQKLAATNRTYEEQRRRLNEDERDIRMNLRDELAAGDSANQSRVSGYLDRMLKIQRGRLDLVEQEQRDLSAFLTPVQRLKYIGFQEQLRKRMEQVRRNRQEMRDSGLGGGGRRRPFPLRPTR
ncbi:MAG: Spy/CpxP family protein refolding chaperone [Gemmatimonadota bacterium]|nr:Spy/CpxP family protein refolding chaperone [Gemmatimonadota bacterium]